jgi:hypothetical protein
VTSERGKMTDERLKEIQERLDKATPGPWQRNMMKLGLPSPHVVDFGRPPKSPFAVLHSDVEPTNTTNDADFIAHSREDIPFLLADNERKDDLIAELRLQLNSALAEIERLKGRNEALKEWAEESVITRSDEADFGYRGAQGEVRDILEGES